MPRQRNIRRTIEGYILLCLVCAALAGLLCILPKKTKQERRRPVTDTAATTTTLYQRDYYEQEPQDYCYVCTGSRSRKYHTTPTCPSSCRREIIELTVAEAVQKGYQPCHSCH